MATRKLKFKPKPVVGGAVRRPREKEEIQESTFKEPNIEKEASEECITTPIDIKNDPSSIENSNDANEGSISKRLRLEQLDYSMLDPQNISVGRTCNLNYDTSAASDLGKESTDGSIPNITSNTSNNFSAQTEQLSEFCLLKSVILEPVSTQSSESNTTKLIYPLCPQEPTSNESSNETNSPLTTGKNSMTSSHSSQESSVNLKSTDKTEASKALPRFGRSKFKPVLNNSIVRKKTETNYNPNKDNSTKSEEYPIAMVRTESVIKCVKSEINKSNIVSEITESFSALESDEPNPQPISHSVSPYIEANDSFEYTCRFDCGNEDVRATMNNSDINTKVYLVNTDKPVQSTKTTSSLEPCEMIDQTDSNRLLGINTQHAEKPNSNTQTLSANKVPISPLKLTSKILVPKPCPNLLDTGVRRISFQGSDSEEEVKRKNVLKNVKIGKKIKKEKDVKNNKRKLSQGSTYSKLGQEALEKFTQKFGKVETLEPTDKAKLTMLDLIFYNPKSNPMSVVSEQTGVRKKEEKFEVSGIVKEALAEESVDDVEVEPSTPAVPVPQLKVGPDGQIMLDPKSLVIETTEVKEKRAEMEKSAVIRETGITRYNTYSKKRHIRKDWTTQETLQFYKALNTIGSDFSLMTKLFPKRTRHELKLKFKKEEKTNLKLVDLAMTAPTDFDFGSLEEELKRENEELARLAEEKKLAAETAKKARAIKKEEKGKKKGSDKKYPSYLKVKGAAAFKDFDEPEIENIMMKCKGKNKANTKKRVPKKKPQVMVIASSSSDEEEIPIHINIDSEEADREESDMRILKIIKRNTRPEKRRGRKIKQVKKLEEYEELNETLKRKLEEVESDSNDGYTPNGPGADMLFGSPARDPFPENQSEEGERSQWSMEVTSVPSVEDTVFVNNIEDVSELSELGSFGQNMTALDLSLPLRTGAQDKPAQGSVHTDSVLNRHLISESIQIIDQLSSSEQVNVDSKNITVDSINEDKNPSKIPTEQGPSENLTPLPSFESVGRSRPPVVYSLQEPYVPAKSHDDNAIINKENDIELRSANQDDKNKKDGSNQQGIVLSYYCSGSEECILGD